MFRGSYKKQQQQQVQKVSFEAFNITYFFCLSMKKSLRKLNGEEKDANKDLMFILKFDRTKNKKKTLKISIIFYFDKHKK